VGSPVIDSLSLKWRGSSSRISVTGAFHFSPRSVDLETRIADVTWSAEIDSEIR
jgi:hypothetical protein